MANPAPPAGLKAVVFDLDGVLLDSQRANVAFYNHLLEAVGLPPMQPASEEVVHRESSEGSLRHLMGEGEHYRQAIEYWKVMDYMPFVRQLDLFPGAHQSLARLGRRFLLGLATNRHTTTGMTLEHTGLAPYFQEVVTPGEAKVDKPDPRFMDMVLAGLGVKKAESVYVGDSSVDEALCQASGVRLVAFQNPGLRAWAHVDTLDELPPLLGA